VVLEGDCLLDDDTMDRRALDDNGRNWRRSHEIPNRMPRRDLLCTLRVVVLVGVQGGMVDEEEDEEEDEDEEVFGAEDGCSDGDIGGTVSTVVAVVVVVVVVVVEEQEVDDEGVEDKEILVVQQYVTLLGHWM
jgi:hypothetical protein